MRAPSGQMYYSGQAFEKHACSFETPYLWFLVLAKSHWAPNTEVKALLRFILALFSILLLQKFLLDEILLFSMLDILYPHRPDLFIQFALLKITMNLTSPASVIWKSTLVLLILSYRDSVALWDSYLILLLSLWVLLASWTLPLDTNNSVNGR